MTLLKNIKFTIFPFLFFATHVLSEPTYTGMNEWYHPHSIALSGAGGAITNLSNDLINPASLYSLGREFDLAILRYPADITAQSFHLSLPAKKTITVYSLRHMNFGLFQGRDHKNNITEDYSASNTWLNGSVAGSSRKLPVRWGITGGVFYSKLEKYQSVVFTLTSGVIIIAKKLNARLGISLQNSGWVLNTYSETKEDTPKMVKISLAKELAYLPLILLLDAEKILDETSPELYFGALFNLRNNIQLKMGTSTHRLTQAGGVSLARDYLSATGVGVTWTGQEYRIESGVYSYGPGGWISGFSIGVTF